MKLTFSAEAQQLARKAMDPANHGVLRIGALGDGLAAALAHDAPRLAREIIAQRVAALTADQLDELDAAFNDDIRAALLRALTEEPTP